MFAGDTESIYSFDNSYPLKAATEPWTTFREREFGWSGNVSGIRAGKDDDAIAQNLKFERPPQNSRGPGSQVSSLGFNDEKDQWEYVKLRKNRSTGENGKALGSRNRRPTPSERIDSNIQSNLRDSASGFKSTQPIHHEDDCQGKKSQPFRSRSCHGARRKSENNEKGSRSTKLDIPHNSNSKRKSWLSDTDEDLYDMSRNVEDLELSTHFITNCNRRQTTGVRDSSPGVGRIFKHLSRRLTMDDKSKRRKAPMPSEGGMYLSHQMVGASSPYPVRPPLPGFDRLSLETSHDLR
ncbi:uncharacterized protein MELLADRAFT_106504 [Melampsora larici-populina 98AG31]|uniref:Uncharacterized protein n=1 Tax=Melampsora larici-populina (strain 98AG31 / pathotype 3-4-7) TaxID=747676 RepID=F4RLQ4_MELLP|nr:uncharacterized protein MELLADRAFT_106504 [Melampsora larici-populina 98AG31]EGG06576.1 hypothetical protein MELLADRAFT_106504 [Melampsora larici-populina 98AG31]